MSARLISPQGTLPQTPYHHVATASGITLTFYVAEWTPDKIEAFMAGVQAVAEDIGLPTQMPPASLIGVEELFERTIGSACTPTRGADR